MSIYTTKQLISHIEGEDRDSLYSMLKRILQLEHSAGMRSKIAAIVLDVDVEPLNKECYLAQDRSIPYKVMRALSESPVMFQVEEIIEAALTLGGPYQTTEIMAIAAQLAPNKNSIDFKHPIPRKLLVEAGYILSMAGLERKSHYIKARGIPVKAWSIKKGWENFTVKARAQVVLATIKQELSDNGPIPNSTAPQSLGDLI